MAVTRRSGEIGVTWNLVLQDDGAVIDLTNATAVVLVISNGNQYTMTVDNASAGAVSYVNDADDIAPGLYTYHVEIHMNTGRILKSQPGEAEIVE